MITMPPTISPISGRAVPTVVITVFVFSNAINAVAGNRVGAILAGTYSPAINGNSGGGLGFTDPNANILY